MILRWIPIDVMEIIRAATDELVVEKLPGIVLFEGIE